MTTLDDLRKTVEMLKEVESLKDDGIRTKMQQLILNAVTPMELLVAPSPERISVEQGTKALKQAQVRATPNRGRAGQPNPTSDRGKLYYALKELASEQEPLSTADLEPIVSSVPTEAISKALSGMYKEGLLQRRQVFEQTRAGANAEIYKYYVPAEPA